MKKPKITNQITPCCGLPFSTVYWWVSNLTLNSESDREFILNHISHGGMISIDAWKVLINSGTLESDAALTKSEFLEWFECGRQPSCDEFKIIIEGYKISNYNPIDNYGVGWTEISSYENYDNKVIKKITDYVGGIGDLPTELSDNIGKYYASLGGFTSDKALATDFKPEGQNLTETSEVITNIFSITQTNSAYDSSTFSGFGFTYGAIKGFNRVVLPIWQRAATTDEVTKVYLRIRETDYQGILLFDGVKDVSIAQGTSQDVTFDFPLIENLTNKNIWVEFVCDGLTRLNISTQMPTQNYRYKTVGHGVTPFATMSTESFSPNNPMVISFKRVDNVINLIPDLTTNKLQAGSTKPIQSGTVYNEFLKYNTAIEDGFQAESSIIKGTIAIQTASSTFKGWGQLISGITSFNRVGYVFRAFDNSMIPTKVRCIIRKTSNTGTVIFDQTKDVSLVLNTDKKVYFDLPETYNNTANDELFISFVANGMIAGIGGLGSVDLDTNHVVKYTTTSLSETTVSSSTNLKMQLYIEILKGIYVKQISESEIQRIVSQIVGFSNPDDLLTSKVWLYPNLQYNIFDKNVIIPNYGDNLENYRIDYSGSIGQQFKRGFRLNNTPVSLNQTITLNLQKGRNVLRTKTQNILSTTTNNGSGNNRKVLIIGDSTVDGGDINIPLKAIFDNDVMGITFLGTRGATGLKHEGRGGWRWDDYYGAGRALYVINVMGLSVSPNIGARYTQGANVYNVEEVNITGGSGYFSVSVVTGSAPTATGTLTKTSGAGDALINYSSMSQTSGNPFYSPSTQKFDIGTYLTNTGQTMSANDIIAFQLGINDMFNIFTLPDAVTKVNTIMLQILEILANITAYNSGIRVAIVVTIPPADQDSFGENYAVGQLAELYKKTGLLSLQKKLIEVYDNDTQRGLNRFLISAHLNLDTEYNFPSADVAVNSRNTKTINMQNNSVHPDANGNYQIADMYAGFIKYFG